MTKRLVHRGDVDLGLGSLRLDENELHVQRQLEREFEESQRKKEERKKLRRQEDERREILRRKEKRQRREDERKYGADADDLMANAFEDGVEHDFSSRINVVGNHKQGKSLLVKALFGDCEKSVYSTNGIDINLYKRSRDASGKLIYEKAHGHDPEDIAKRINRSKIQRRDSFREKVKNYFTSSYVFKKFWGENNPVRLPKDMKEERHKVIQEIKQNEKHTSDKDEILQNMYIWDFAGQIDFYATHTLFHSRKAIYLLVFNLSLRLSDFVLNDDEKCRVSHGKRTMEYYIRFWVNSIHSFVGNKDNTEPIIILVGTHFDLLTGTEEEKKQIADKYFDDIRSLFKGKQAFSHIFNQDFALNTYDTQSKTIKDLRETLEDLGYKLSLSTTVPVKWIQLEKCLFERRHEKIVTFPTVVEIDAESEYPLKDKEQIKLFLKHKHDQGILVYFDVEPQFVVLDPQYLVDAFKCLITAKRFVTNMHDIYPAWEVLVKEGKLQNALIDKLWSRKRKQGFMKHKETILWFLQKHRIISQAMEFNEKTKVAVDLGWYVVPSLLLDHSRAEEILKFQKRKMQTKIQYVMSFDNSAIVPTIFNRVIAAALGKWSVLEFRGKKLLFENLSIVRIDMYHAGAIRLNDRHIHLSLMGLCPRQHINRFVADEFRRYAESVVKYEFRKHEGVSNERVMPFTRGFTCNHENHRPNGGINIIEFGKDISINCSTCPDVEFHEIETSTALEEWFQGKESFPNVPTGCPSSATLQKFSQNIGCNWEILGHALGIPRVKLEHIKDENRSTVKQIFSMLLEWRDMHDDDVTLHQVITKLQELPEVTVNWNKITNIIDEINAQGK